MKTTLTIKQSAELVKRGVTLNENDSEVFDIGELLSLLPKEIGGRLLNISANTNGWEISYEDWRGDDTIFVSVDKELIEALYSTLLWVIDNNHIKLD